MLASAVIRSTAASPLLRSQQPSVFRQLPQVYRLHAVQSSQRRRVVSSAPAEPAEQVERQTDADDGTPNPESLKPELVPQSQLRKHFVSCMVPMIGFGFMDNTVMLHAGNAIDTTLGVTFGLSTLAAAACGQVCSDMAGVGFGGFIEAAAAKLGLPEAHLTDEQRATPVVRRIGVLGGMIGVAAGCTLGFVNLLFIDTDATREKKLAAESSNSAGFKIHVSNTENPHATTVRLEGPSNVEGVIASVTTAMAVAGCRIQGMQGHRDEEDGLMSFTFVLTRHGEQVEDDQVSEFGRTLMAACNNTGIFRRLSFTNEELRKENAELRQNVERVEALLESSGMSTSKTVRDREASLPDPPSSQ
eukprot:TRINITY_DN49294_c0_g1_i1.p1 TRINITY_DN49294_c0_g1~~TRINITY_DN49294_c0_g1_i1.p1  ORF type:complete len:377 (+),score=79.55 TRINITY_DN49294_c0_g1_i1:55-1131(+)